MAGMSNLMAHFACLLNLSRLLARVYACPKRLRCISPYISALMPQRLIFKRMIAHNFPSISLRAHQNLSACRCLTYNCGPRFAGSKCKS